jgi:RluA family pseudouridine synthase
MNHGAAQSIMHSLAISPLSAEDIQARVLFRDGLMIALNKPSGMPVHAGFGGGPNLEDSFEHLTFGLPRPPSLAHRLDRDTSGCLILGRHRKALQKLNKLFAGGRVRKTYWAIVEGAPKRTEGRIELALKKIGRGPGWKMKGDRSGQAATTDYKVCGSFEGPAGVRTWLELRPHTGRTHQLRVHSLALGCPIVGDHVYGASSGRADETLMLHAQAISLPLYPKRKPVEIIAPPPQHIQNALVACGFVTRGPDTDA